MVEPMNSHGIAVDVHAIFWHCAQDMGRNSRSKELCKVRGMLYIPKLDLYWDPE